MSGKGVTGNKDDHREQPKDGQHAQRTVDRMERMFKKIIGRRVINAQKINDAQKDRNGDQSHGRKGVDLHLFGKRILTHAMINLSYYFGG